MTKQRPPSPDPYPRIYAVVARIPYGRVATYAQVATFASLPGRARQVGRALATLPEGSPVPWHRVINARGEVSPRGGMGIEEGFQRHLLEQEAVRFDARGRIDLDRFGWEPEGRPPLPRAKKSARTARLRTSGR